jgi:hypothetical protein
MKIAVSPFGAVNAPPDHRLEIDIRVPPGRRSLSEYEIRFAALRSIFSRRGVDVSRAALEELLPRFKFKSNEQPVLRRVNYAGVVKGAYLIQLSSATELQALAWRREAEQITRAKTPPVHGTTGAERYERAVQIALDRYLDRSLAAEVEALVAPESIAHLVALSAAAAAAQGTPAGWALSAAGALGLGAEGVRALTDFKDFVMYAGFAEKPSDLDRAARSLANVAARVGGGGLAALLGRGAVKALRVSP